MTSDLFTSEDRYLPWITTATVFTLPTTLGIAHARVTLARRRSPNLRTGCRIIATQQLDSLTVPSTPYVFNNLYLLLVPPACWYKHNCNRFNGHERLFFLSIGPQQSAISSRWGAVIPGCDYRWLRNDFNIPRAPENMSHKNIITIHFHIWTWYTYHCNI